MKDTWMSIGIGLFFGVLMSILVLYMMISSSFTLMTPAFWISVIVSCALPHCLSIVRVSGLKTGISQISMVILSYGITLLYGSFISNASALVSQYADVFSQVFVLSTILHISSAVSIVLRGLILRSKK